MQSFTPPHTPLSQMHTTQPACGGPSLSLTATHVCDAMRERLPSQQRLQRNVWNVCILQPTSTWSVHFPFIPDQARPPFSFSVILSFFTASWWGCRGPTSHHLILHSHSAACAIGWGLYAHCWTGHGKHSNSEIILEPIIQMVHSFSTIQLAFPDFLAMKDDCWFWTAFEMTQNSGQRLKLVETTMDYLLRKHEIMNQTFRAIGIWSDMYSIMRKVSSGAFCRSEGSITLKQLELPPSLGECRSVVHLLLLF